MKTFLIDSDVLIDVLRNVRKTVDALNHITAAGEFASSCITFGEIYAGMHPNEEELTRTLLKTLTPMPVTEEIAELGGRIKYATRSHTLGLGDCLIAATALIHNFTLVTKNVKHYPFPKLEIIKIS